MIPFAISLNGVSKSFVRGKQKTYAVQGVTLKIHEGEFFIFAGPSGCGKSTLLRIMSGLDVPTEGTVEYGHGIFHNEIGFVFQQFALLPWLTVSQNVELGLIARDVPERERKPAVLKELKRFGLERFAQSFPRELSGGMRQRVGIARALVCNPKILFLDEPFSELDSFTAETLRRELLDIWRERHLTVIMVSHVVPETIELADRVAIMTPHPGKLEKLVPITLARPRQMRTQAAFDLEDQLKEIIKP